MVHPGLVVASVFGVVVTGVVLYTILKEEIHDFLESFEKPIPVGYGYEQPRDQQQQRGQRSSGQDDHDFNQGRSGQSSSMYQADYELRQRRSLRPNEDEDENENEKEPDNDILMERLRKINETEQAIAAGEARLAEMERAMREREQNLQRREQELDSIQQQQQMPQSSEIYQNPFASNEPLIRNYSNNDDAQFNHPTSTIPEINPRTANAILRHNLSGNHQENVNPFADPASLLENASSSSTRSSVHGDDDMDAFADAETRSVTVGRDDEDLDWTEAEIGSVGSQDSDEFWQ